MGEFIRRTPEEETTSERFFWDRFILALEKVSNRAEESGASDAEPFDLVETLESMRGETEEDAINLLVSYVVMVETPEEASTSSDFEEVWNLLREYGFEPEE